MKSIVVNGGYGVDRISLLAQDIPSINESEILVKVMAVSLNQLDLMLAKGAFEKPLPHILGSDAVGVVEQIGSKVTAFKTGDRISTHYIQGWQKGELKPEDLKTRLGIEQRGVFSEYIAVPEEFLVAAPSNLTFEEVAATPFGGCNRLGSHFKCRRTKGGTNCAVARYRWCFHLRPAICKGKRS
ncbi:MULTISPECIES: alcohol dehydrogenase catalytic domain-containing protein [Sphingobacterium]|uniref:alcohol dehydrogenase catalytic domain-containing protein n=1 Tax=Sphingobacterium TaxID=28453 RepID=UPI00257EF8BA|nr:MULTISPECIES: alcohol dehydrogenase catalytic domain-containing protein [Sphingobacterium]